MDFKTLQSDTQFGNATDALLNGESILFAGAGLGYGMLDSAGRPLLVGTQLRDLLAGESGLPPHCSLEDAAEGYAGRFGDERLVQILQSRFTVSQVSDYHRVLGRLPWRRVYTTNYDNGLEMAFREEGMLLSPITSTDRAVPGSGAGIDCFHLNGFIDRVTSSNLEKEIRLTDSSYLAGTLESTPGAAHFRSDLRLARAVFFLGYSLFDIDVRRILFDTPDLQAKTFFIVGPDPDPTLDIRVRKFGRMLAIAASDFINLVADRARLGGGARPKVQVPPTLSHWSRPATIKEVTDEDYFELVLLGNLQPELAWSSRAESSHYLLRRASVDAALECIRKPSSALTVLSELGNGKSSFLHALGWELLEKGWDVYEPRAESDENDRALVRLFESSSNDSVLLVDDYTRHFRLLETFSLNAPSRWRIVVAARSTLHDIRGARLAEVLAGRTQIEFPIDRLTQGELGTIVQTFDHYGLWGARAGDSAVKKLDHLRVHCEAQYHEILLDVFHAPQIVERLNRITASIRSDTSNFGVVLSILVLTQLQIICTPELLFDIWGYEVVGRRNFRTDPAIRQLIDLESSWVRIRSSVAAQAVLRMCATTGEVLDVLVQLVLRSARYAKKPGVHTAIVRELILTRSVQSLLPSEVKVSVLLEYYEKLKGLDFLRTDPLFWLQYAIAAYLSEEWERADRYLADSYSYAARRRDFDTFQIDNHYARFCLLRVIATGGPGDPISAFRAARKIVNEQIVGGRNETRDYPYRVATLFEDFWNRFRNDITASQRSEIQRAAQHVLDRIHKLPPDRKQRLVLERCARAMRRVVSVELGH